MDTCTTVYGTYGERTRKSDTVQPSSISCHADRCSFPVISNTAVLGKAPAAEGGEGARGEAMSGASVATGGAAALGLAFVVAANKAEPVHRDVEQAHKLLL